VANLRENSQEKGKTKLTKKISTITARSQRQFEHLKRRQMRPPGGRNMAIREDHGKGAKR